MDNFWEPKVWELRVENKPAVRGYKLAYDANCEISSDRILIKIGEQRLSILIDAELEDNPKIHIHLSK